MKPLFLSAAASLMLATAPLAVMANETIAQAEEMLAKAKEMRAEADTLAEKAEAMIEAAKAEAAAAATAATAAKAEAKPEEDTAEAEAGDGTPDNIKVAYEEDGKYFTEDDIPTYNIAEDGTVDWYAFSGFRRYHSECHVCHGPDGEGSTYAPALKKSALEMDYYDFVDVIVNGRKHVGASDNSVMPAFGTNKNVMCYVDDIYVYLKARGTEALDRGRPAKKEKKSATYVENENACMG
jgi:methanol metabolism-related c-type cytochrome